MAFEVEWLKGAKDELDAELTYVLNEFGFLSAQKTYRRITEYVNRLSIFPQMESVYPDLTFRGCEVRKLPIRQLTLFYSPQADRVTILAVWNNYQDPERMFLRLVNPE